MRLLDISFEARFSKKAPQFKEDFRLKLINRFDPIYENKVAIGVNIKPKSERLLLSAEEKRYGISVQYRDIKRAKSKIKQYVEEVNKTIDYVSIPIARLGLKTIWIEKCTIGLDDLKNLYKTKFFKDNFIIKHSEDYNVTLTLAYKDFNVNYMSGPVGKNEPLAQVNFPVSGLNDANVYINVDCFIIDIGNVDIEGLNKTIDSAVEAGQEIAKKTLESLGL